MEKLGLCLGILIGVLTSLVICQTEDFAFEQENVQTPTLPCVKRLWGIPDSKAQVGKLLQMFIPVDAFEGPVTRYQATEANGKSLPNWLRLDANTGLMEGVPTEMDVGEVYIEIVAVGQQPLHIAKDYFAIEVLPFSYSQQNSVKEQCSPGEDVTTLTIVLDKSYSSISSDSKIALLKNLARYFAMPFEELSLFPQSDEDTLSDSSIMAGPGNIKRKQTDKSTIVQWQVGCNGKVLPKYGPQLQQIKHNAYDGTLAEVVQLPVVGWHLSTSSSNSPIRRRREIFGSGDNESDNETEDLNNLEGNLLPSENVEAVPETRIIPVAVSPVYGEPSATLSVTVDSHHHRHHHGEEPPVSIEPTYTSLLTSPVPFGTIMPTPTFDPERPTVLPTLLVTSSQPYEEFSVAPTPVINQVEPSVTPEMSTPQEKEQVVVESSSEQSSTEALTSSPGIESTTKQQEVIPVENNPPVINHKLPRQAITAGKPFRYVIPETVFSDAEDGNTRRLHLSLKTQEGTPVHYPWITFNPEMQEVIALPLEEQVSRWTFTLEARDSEGLVVSDILELSVQHHKARRTVTHALTVDLAVQQTPPPVEWQLTLVDRLAALYGDPDSALITVLKVKPQDDPITFTWTNDSLPRNHCPRDQIDNLLKVLQENEDGKPTDRVRNLLSPQMTVVQVSWQGKGTCETGVPEPLPPSVQNFAPIPRNQVDLLNATQGQLLVHTVPEDTFYDPEDGSARNMKLSLLNMDRTPISTSHWLQFDIKNQEFYGIPMAASDIGRTEYQLVCKDSGGLTAYDGLVVVVQPAVKAQYNVEFSITLSNEVDHDNFAYTPAVKRHFVERLAELFGDRNASSIVLSGVSANPTVIVWHNRSLPIDYCPDDQIKPLKYILLDDNDRVAKHVNTIMGPEFPVVHASVIPTGVCQGSMTPIHPIQPVHPSGDVKPVSRPHEEYLVTVVVPAIVIAAMLLCAGFVACALYRRRRTGKMSVGSEDERQSFRSKGIPVIFQDELEERPEPANKSPVIMKEEKPPLPPPEYHQRTALLSDVDHHEDSPYQPPPPFASSRDSARPKPTPTYRMPPPYVPP